MSTDCIPGGTRPCRNPAHRHGCPGAGWYLATTQGWRPLTDAEAANERYEGMRHFMRDPREAGDGDPHEPQRQGG